MTQAVKGHSPVTLVPFVFIRKHIDRVGHETSDGTHVRVAVRRQDDPEVGTLAAIDVYRPEKFALMAFWHIYNFPRNEIICYAHNPLFPVKELTQRALMTQGPQTSLFLTKASTRLCPLCRL
jgi:hypothetical protein